MQLQLAFHTLLSVFLISLSLQFVVAIPLDARQPGMVTLPLQRVQQKRSGVHPQIYLQQHLNRGLRRLARMTGREGPSTEDLKMAIYKRAFPDDILETRYNRYGVPKSAKSRAITEPGSFANNARRKGKHGQGNGANAGTGSKTNGTSNAGNAAAANGVTIANNPTADNSLGLDIEAQDVGYLATIQMGTPPQNFLILMDSGSADLWVGAENCQSQGGGGCGNHNFLGTQSSSSFKDTQKPFSVTYGTGQVSGDIIQDDISVAGLALKAHTFGVATTESVDFSSDSTPFDGLMGLAQSTLSEQRTPTPIEALASAGLVKAAITSYKISRLADAKNDGEITFGDLDQTKFDPQTLTTIKNVNTQGFWEGAMDAVSVDGKDTGLQGRTAILDTGTTLIVAPQSDAEAVHAAIPGAQSDGQGGFTVPCNTKASVALTFGGTSFAIDPRDIAFQPVNPNDPNGDCVSGIASGNIGGATEWLVGDVFLKNAYFSTNVDKNTVSLAKLV